MIYEEILTSKDPSTFCRTCLNQNDNHNMLPMEGLYLLSGEIKLLDILTKYTSFEENDNYPQHICVHCVAKAEEAYCFFNKCNESNEILDKFAGNVGQISEDDFEEISLKGEESLNGEDQGFEVITIKNDACEDTQIKIILNHTSLKEGLIDVSDDCLNEQVYEEELDMDEDVDEEVSGNQYFKTVKCEYCRMELELDELEEHKTNYGHFSESNSFMCPQCDNCANNVTNFKMHLRTHSKRITRQFECKLCNKVFKWHRHYSEHLKIHLANEEEKFMCPECGLLLPTVTILQSHRLREHSDVACMQNEWTCHKCEEVFEQIAEYKKHLKEIHFEKDFHCIICGKDCVDRRTLYYHEQLHLDKFGIECSYCSKKLLTEEKLVLHQRIHRYITKKHVCHICDKGFKQLDKLEAHIRVHTGEKPYTCNFCGKAFNHQNNLHHHTRLHTGDTPYKCLFCSKEFSNSHSLRKHMSSHPKVKDELD